MNSNRVVVVTGARGLIGRAVCAHLREVGNKVLELDLTLGHDLTDEGFVKEWFAANPADSLVNLFAINDHVAAWVPGLDLTFRTFPLETFSKVLEVNVVSLFSVCREYLLTNPKGTVVNFTSIYGIEVPPKGLIPGREKEIAYGVSKAAVIQLTRHLAVYAAPGARLNCILLGGIEAGQPNEFVESYSIRTPLQRMGRLEDIFGAVRYLISEDSCYVTGSVLSIDGGWTL